ncbi:type II toxin-antitoxin system Rv0910 family toxin [Nocardia sp. NBC_01327]|uniref:type II toxin-antitoxin system Rv0910 family toxin n=1 Tax=Nocardia sp. NBC_01327 TaxID=2903593 RepID=UPI002E154A8B|nr:SRPBCC family protein [Nocardia sp. NBC_01327]
MGAILLSRDLPGTPEALFNTIISPTTWEHWFGIHREFVGKPPERLIEGSTLVSEVLIHGMAEEVEWTARRLDEPHRVVLRGIGQTGVQCDFTYWLQATATGTTVTAGITFTGLLITDSVTKVLEKHGYEQLDRTLGQLAELACALHE